MHVKVNEEIDRNKLVYRILKDESLEKVSEETGLSYSELEKLRKSAFESCEFRLSCFEYSPDWYDLVYHVAGVGTKVRTFEEVNAQYETSGYRKRLELVLDQIGFPSSSLKWLEVGCHLGLTAYWIAEWLPNVKLHMFDFSKESVKWCKDNFPYQDRATIWQSIVENIQLPGQDLTESFDMVTCIDVTEHLPEAVYRKGILEIYRVLKPGGCLILMQGNSPSNEHINILPEQQLVSDFISAGLTFVRDLPHRHHLFQKPVNGHFNLRTELLDGDVVAYQQNENEESGIDTMLKQGENLYAAGYLGQAKTCFKEILKIDPDHIEALNNLGVIAFQEGDCNEASRYFYEALEIDNAYPDAIENLRRCLELKSAFQ